MKTGDKVIVPAEINGYGRDLRAIYAIIQYLANGDLLFNSVAGPIRVKY